MYMESMRRVRESCIRFVLSNFLLKRESKGKFPFMGVYREWTERQTSGFARCHCLDFASACKRPSTKVVKCRRSKCRVGARLTAPVNTRSARSLIARQTYRDRRLRCENFRSCQIKAVSRH